jgi:methyl-accepting chemotaxis protein
VFKSIKARLLARFGAVGVALILAATFVAVLATMVQSRVSESIDLSVASARLAEQIDYDVIQVQGWLTDISATRGADGYDDGFTEAATWAEEFHRDVAELVTLHPEQAEPMAILTERFEEFYSLGRQMAEAYIAGGPDAGNVMMAEFDEASESLSASLELVHADIDADIVVMQQEVAATTGMLRSITAAGALAVLIGVLVMALRTASAFSRPIVEMAEAARRAASGDTSVTVRHESDDELGVLADSLRALTGYLQQHAETAITIAGGDTDVIVEPRSDRDTLGVAMKGMVETLTALLGAVTSASGTLGRQAGDLSTASGDLTASAESVAATITHLAGAALDQTSAADLVSSNVTSIVEQLTEFAALTASIVDAADGAVAQSAQGAENVTVIHQTMQSTVNAIDDAATMVDDLGKRSEQVAQAVVLIQQIADQTNLLALNAAIEAARAGEAGRGFAVVATEVKQLAEQASSSAGQIAQIVAAMTGSVSRVVASTEVGRAEVKRGAELIGGLDADLGGIRMASQSVLDDIRAAAGRIEVVQQAAESIVGGIDALSQTAESNAAATEEVAAVSEESAATADDVQRSAQALDDVAGSLTAALGAFRSRR